MSDYPPGVHRLADQIGLHPHYVYQALRSASRTFDQVQAITGMSDDQLRSLLASNAYAVAFVAEQAMHNAGRPHDAQLLMDVYKAALGTTTTAHRPVTRSGVGTLPAFQRHPHVQQAVRILTAAGLPPIETDGIRELKPGFQVLLADTGEMPGWLYIAPDPDAPRRTGFAGGDLGYLAVLRWAGWGVITDPMPSGLWAVCHPDYRDNTFPS